jgi:ectoine hydroxylase
VIPRSHHRGLIATTADAGGKDVEYQNITVNPDVLREMAQRDGVTALTGPIGTMVFMHCCLVHGSAENISPLRRALFSVAFNSVDNRAQHPRTEHYATANVVPVRPLADDCLLTTAS